MIENLCKYSICDRPGGAIIEEKAPDNYELMEKINELIDAVNELQRIQGTDDLARKREAESV